MPTPEDHVASQTEADALAYAASHDLRQPLRTILHCLELLEHRHGDELSDEAKALLARGLNATHRGHQMIDGLLEYSRVTSRAGPFVETPMQPLIERIQRDLKEQIATSQATITTADLPTVVGDRKQLTRLMRHLLENAIKFCGDSPPVIHVHGRTTDTGWYIDILDQGIGVPDQQTDRMTQLYRTLNPPGAYDGTGSGLAICRKIVDRHEGTLSIVPAQPKGTCVTLFLPVRPPEDSVSSPLRVRPAAR